MPLLGKQMRALVHGNQTVASQRKLKTWAEVKARRPLSDEAQAANASWVEQQILTLADSGRAVSWPPAPRQADKEL
jgi:hypothetical protein